MAIRLTKTSKVIFALAIVVLSGLLAFLIWRVNQESQLDPTDSDAGSNQCNCCNTRTCAKDTGTLPPCKTIYAKDGCYLEAPANPIPCDCVYQSKSCPGKKICGSDDEEPYVPECDEGSDCKACVWPNVAFCISGKCECKRYDTPVSDPCKDPSPTCNPVCPPGEGDPYFINDGQTCRPGESIVQCTANCAGCNNPYIAKACCKPQAVANVCDGGSWVNKPSGNINFEDDISFSAKAQDADGIDKASIVVKRGTTTIPVCTTGQTVGCVTLSEAATETTITGTLSNATNRLPEGTYTISMSWKDKKGATSTACALSTSFTVLPEQKNPNWTITKGVVEQCIDENTPDPKSEITYTVTVRNTGEGSGTISKIEDVLDTKVQDSFVQVSSITAPGVYSNKKIVWDYTSSPLTLAAGETKVFTYKLVIGKEAFDTYSNTVTLTPVGSSTVVAAANITADCEVTDSSVPATGLFDTTASRILGGFVLVIFGIAVYNLPNSKFAKKEYKYREKFERKVANR